MTESRRSSDAAQWAYDRYIKGDTELEKYYDELGHQVRIAQQVYDIRNRLRMTQEELAELSGLTAQDIKNIEETDYDGSWREAVILINGAFRRWFQTVIIPAASMTEAEYLVQEKHA